MIFELGFFMSRLGRHRTILLVPRQTEIKLASDFKGLIPLEYASAPDPKTRAELMGPAIDRIRNVVDHLKVRTSFSLPVDPVLPFSMKIDGRGRWTVTAKRQGRR